MYCKFFSHSMSDLEKGYSLIKIAAAFLITGLAIIFGMYFLQKYNLIPKNTSTMPNSSTLELNTEEAMPSEPLTKEIPSDKGVIEGTYIFPSEGIPKTLIPCAEHISTNEIICSESLGETGQTDTFMIIVPPGSYYVYAVNTADPNSYKAYYTEFVTCGLLASCPSHEKIAIEVAAGETVLDIKPHDWYDPSQQP